jgi:conjugative coupling factor TraD (SXT/TOL subfamily)
MSVSEMFDNRIRFPYESISATGFIISALLLTVFPEVMFPLMPLFSIQVGVVFLVIGLYRCYQIWSILRYKKQLGRLPLYQIASDKIKFYENELILGRGFIWTPKHSQRMREVISPEHVDFYKKILAKNDKSDLGGNPALHGVGVNNEHEITINNSDRVSHMLVLGRPRMGKSRLEEYFIIQDMRRGEVVIVLDPKGDIGLLKRMYSEAKKLGKLDRFHIIHLGFSEISERYNPIGESSRFTEVATRTSGNLNSEGESAAFKEFAWLYINVIANALREMGSKTNFDNISKYLRNIVNLTTSYLEHFFSNNCSKQWINEVADIENNLSQDVIDDPNLNPHLIALIKHYENQEFDDQIADSLLEINRMSRDHFSKLTAGLQAFLEKMTTGNSARIISPTYDDPDDKRPVLDWYTVIRQGGFVYIGFDALTDKDVARAFASTAFSDITSVTGKLYKFDEIHGLTNKHIQSRRKKIVVHADELSELLSDMFVPMVNKAGGAGVSVTGYTQSLQDISVGLGSQDKAESAIDNLGSLVCLRIGSEATAKVITTLINKTVVYTKIAESRFTDDNNPDSDVDFVSQNADRLSETSEDLLKTSDLVQLPKGQGFALIKGGVLHKLRFPLITEDSDLPENLDIIKKERLEHYDMGKGS